jgi:uncharacterized protein YjcR
MAARNPYRKSKMTARQIAEKSGCTVRTVVNWFAIPRAEWEANSITRAAPWKAMGISRATWYRRGKPTTKQLEAVKHESSETNPNRT